MQTGAATGLAELIDYGVHKMFRIEHNVETGEIKQIQLSSEEIAELEIQHAAAKASAAAAQAEVEAKAAQRQALLNRLGITEEEARILLGGN